MRDPGLGDVAKRRPSALASARRRFGGCSALCTQYFVGKCAARRERTSLRWREDQGRRKMIGMIMGSSPPLSLSHPIPLIVGAVIPCKKTKHLSAAGPHPMAWHGDGMGYTAPCRPCPVGAGHVLYGIYLQRIKVQGTGPFYLRARASPRGIGGPPSGPDFALIELHNPCKLQAHTGRGGQLALCTQYLHGL